MTTFSAMEARKRLYKLLDLKQARLGHGRKTSQLFKVAEEFSAP